MPNHITTVCTVTGSPEAIDAFVAAHFRITEDEKPAEIFDFKTIIPQPEIVGKTESGSEAEQGFFALTGLHKVGFAMFADTPMHMAARHQGFPLNAMTTPEHYREWLEQKSPEAIRKGKLALQCFRETGHVSWYEWNVANWGTKWGAYSFERRFREPQKLVFKFETAWSFPEPIFAELVKRHPALTFDVLSIDEGGPEYEGRYTATEQRFERASESDDRYLACYGKSRPNYDEDGEEVEPVLN